MSGMNGKWRRVVPAVTLLTLLAGCVTATEPSMVSSSAVPANVAARYGKAPNEKFDVAAIDAADLRPEYVRQLVDYNGNEAPGTIVVDPRDRFLYLVMENGKALRYGVGVGKEGLEFTGKARIGRKATWPHWTPTPNMIRREPNRYGKWAGGMEGGATNPLGARALYLHKGGKDTLFRIHGTNEPDTIGHAVSSGCIRMLNQDVIDLYSRVPVGANVVVR
jgi:lipoprotein-anchoring transpeptidase ErfK/SrfK